MIKQRTFLQKSRRTLLLFEQLSLLLKMNISMAECIRLLNHKTLTKFDRRLLHQIQNELEHGESLAAAFGSVQDYFDPWALQLLNIATQQQQTQTVIDLYIYQQNNIRKIRQSIKQQCYYPCLLVLLSLGILYFFQNNVEPKYMQLQQQLQPQMHLSKKNTPSFAFYLSLSMILSCLFIKTSYLYKLPWIGTLKQQMEWHRWISLMHLGLNSGLPFQSCLEHIQTQTQKLYLHRWHCQLISQLRLGELKMSQFTLPKGVPRNIQHLLQMLRFHADIKLIFQQSMQILEYDIHQQIKKLELYLNPLLLCLIAGLCGYICFLIYQPLLTLGKILY